MSNPVRFGQEFTGRLANPRDVLSFHRAKKAAARSGKVVMDQPELSIDDPDMPIGEKLEKVRVATLVKEYLAAQELQLLGENGMSDAIQTFVDKDDIHSISRCVDSLCTICHCIDLLYSDLLSGVSALCRRVSNPQKLTKRTWRKWYEP